MRFSSHPIFKIILALSLIILFNGLNPAIPAYAQTSSDVPIFVILASEHQHKTGLADVRTLIETRHGRITHTFPYQALIATVPAGLSAEISALSPVAAVFTGPVELSTTDIYGPHIRRLAGVWNSLIAPQPAAETMNTLAEYPEDHHDAFIAPDVPDFDSNRLAAAGAITPGYYQTSEFMAGSVAVGIILVESNGSTDPSTENWTADERQQVFNEIVAGLNWWAELDPRANLSFVYDDHFSEPLPTGVEPITRPYYDQKYWIADALGSLGYNASSYFTRARDYNNAIRTVYDTDWAFTIFVVDSSADSDNRFSDGYFAYAYLGGPFTVMTSGNNGYGLGNMDAVLTHEMGHIFHALDQYYSAYQPCTYSSGYLEVENQNSQYGSCSSNVTSIMRGQIYPFRAQAIDPYAAGQIGWRDSDGDDIFDPLDTALPITISAIATDDGQTTVTGHAEITPYPSPSRPSATINTLTQVQYRLDDGEWQPATAGDGAFDQTTESYHFSLPASITPGLHLLEVTAHDSAGNISETFAADTLAVFDPVDGGLNTEFNPLPENLSAASNGTTITGLAYHMDGGTVVNVEYRLNDTGPWIPAAADDGAFDSDYEVLTLALDPSLEPGTYHLEARATDHTGYIESNVASEEITLTAPGENVSVFLPLVLGGK